jgi:hypothetical protein
MQLINVEAGVALGGIDVDRNQTPPMVNWTRPPQKKIIFKVLDSCGDEAQGNS